MIADIPHISQYLNCFAAEHFTLLKCSFKIYKIPPDRFVNDSAVTSLSVVKH